MSELIILAGPNGSGKSTLKEHIEKEDINFSKLEWINADELKITHNITEQQAFDLANKMREKYLKEGISFVTETVFSHPSKLEFIDEAKKNGYKVTVHFVTTENPNININRVSARVQKGGHGVPEEKIVNRYNRVMQMLPAIISKSDEFYLYDNSISIGEILSKIDNRLEITPLENPSLWNREVLKKLCDDVRQIERKTIKKEKENLSFLDKVIKFNPEYLEKLKENLSQKNVSQEQQKKTEITR